MVTEVMTLKRCRILLETNGEFINQLVRRPDISHDRDGHLPDDCYRDGPGDVPYFDVL